MYAFIAIGIQNQPSASMTTDQPKSSAKNSEAENQSRPELARILAIPGFARLLASEALFDIGVVARTAAQSWVTYEITGSNLWVGAVAGVRAVPVLLLPLLTGAMADRFDRRRLLFLVRIALAIISLVQALLIAFDVLRPWHMLALALCAGSVVAFGAPAFWAYISDLVNPKALPRATALVMAVENAGEMVGPVLAGGLIAAAGAEYSFGLIAAIYLFGAFVIISAPLGQHADADPKPDVKTSYYESMKEGLAFARRSPVLPWLFLMNASVNIFGVAVFPLIPEYATNVFDVGSLGFGVMTGVLGVGFAVGSGLIALTGMPQRVLWVMLVSSLIWDSCMIAFGFSRIYPLTLAILFVMGVSGMFWVNAIINLFQRAAEGPVRGRVMSLYAIGTGLFPLGWAYGGALSTLIGNELTLIVSALGGTPLVILALVASPGLRRS